MQTACASNHVPRNLISLIIINQQQEATDLTTGFLLGLQHILATPLKGAYLSIPNHKTVLSFMLPPAPMKELLINLKTFAGLNIQLRRADRKSLLLRQAHSFFIHFKIVWKYCPYSTWAQSSVQSAKRQIITCCSRQSLVKSHIGQNASSQSLRGMKSNVYMGLSPVFSWWQRHVHTERLCTAKVLKSTGCNKYF